MAEPGEKDDKEWERKNWGWGVGCGVFLLLLGLFITIGGYFAGGDHWIMWGMIVVGILAIIGGLMMKGSK